ncbi:MAG TPA: glycine cleavage system aminomethyltransferase GcvT, partial [Coriobacteriia bacterium]|nr:glycine cleavage system aminomethyltransferase GcvT [Coriobacteriia bacterium]
MVNGTELRTPLHDEHVALGARMVDFAGWRMPVQYAGIIEEHTAVRTGVGIFDVSHMGEFRVFGVEAKAALQRIVTKDLDRIEELGSALYTVMCDEDGGVIDDLIVYHTGDIEY